MKKNRIHFLLAITGTLLYASVFSQQVQPAKAVADNLAIEKIIRQDPASFYYVDFKKYPKADASLPIGVFDSGTGGMTVLEAILNYDKNNNSTKKSGADHKADFQNEKFIYLADQANMPYGNYYATGKSSLLIEHILKDAQFMLSDKYYADANSPNFKTDKQLVKTIVIACNTATAYGKKHLEEFMAKSGIQIKIIGVIDAGAKGALSLFDKNEDGSIGVMATVGTVASKGYGNTLNEMKNKLGYTGNIQIYNQGGYGIAEAVDEEPDFIDRKAVALRENYRGPSLQNDEYRIDKTLMDIYNFDFDHQKMLCDTRVTDDCQSLQINSTDNYVRYHLVTMMENIRKTPGAQALKAILLGCTHYPYLKDDIKKVLNELYNYKKNDKYIYRHLMVENIELVDPAINVAEELYSFLRENNLLNKQKTTGNSEFYITVPNRDNPNVITDKLGNFPYDYKYGREANEIQEYVKVVLYSKENISDETIVRFRKSIPASFTQLVKFGQSNPKINSLAKDKRILE